MKAFSLRTGFTLIELLIVVAIIAILAAIAVPNFLEAQTRSKVSRAQTDMRSLATAVEAYAVDWNSYPYTPGEALDFDGYGNLRAADMLTIPDSVTTPVAYITSHVPDVFRIGKKVGGVSSASFGRPFENGNPRDLTFMWLNMKQANNEGEPAGFAFFASLASWETHFNQWGWWQMRSIGPSGFYPGSPNYPGVGILSVNAIYDPTNGTVSLGQVIRNQKSATGQQATP